MKDLPYKAVKVLGTFFGVIGEYARDKTAAEEAMH